MQTVSRNEYKEAKHTIDKAEQFYKDEMLHELKKQLHSDVTLLRAENTLEQARLRQVLVNAEHRYNQLRAPWQNKKCEDVAKWDVAEKEALQAEFDLRTVTERIVQKVVQDTHNAIESAT